MQNIPMRGELTKGQSILRQRVNDDLFVHLVDSNEHRCSAPIRHNCPLNWNAVWANLLGGLVKLGYIIRNGLMHKLNYLGSIALGQDGVLTLTRCVGMGTITLLVQ